MSRAQQFSFSTWEQVAEFMVAQPNLVKAHDWEISSFFKTKATYFCGSCNKRNFENRDTHHLSNIQGPEGNPVISFCSHCSEMNYFFSSTGLIFKEF